MDREMLDAVGASRASQKSEYLRDGKFLLMVKELIYKKMEGGLTFVARVEVLESESKGDLDLVTGKPVIPNVVGTSAGWIQLTQKHKSAAGNIKAFVLALLNYSEAEVDAKPGSFGEALGELISTQQPARGMVIRASSYRQMVRSGPNAGKIQTYMAFTPAADLNTADRILARRTDLDKREPIQK